MNYEIITFSLWYVVTSVPSGSTPVAWALPHWNLPSITSVKVNRSSYILEYPKKDQFERFLPGFWKRSIYSFAGYLVLKKLPRDTTLIFRKLRTQTFFYGLDLKSQYI